MARVAEVRYELRACSRSRQHCDFRNDCCHCLVHMSANASKHSYTSDRHGSSTRRSPGSRAYRQSFLKSVNKSRVEPQYPHAARSAGYEGMVVIQAVVKKDGT